MSAVAAFLVAFSLVTTSSGLTPGQGAVHEDVGYRDRGPVVAELNRRLAAAGFNPDEGSVFGKKTRHAVYAFQKHYGLATTGDFTPFMWDLLDRPIELPRRGDPDRVEVDLAKQVLYVVEGGRVTVIVSISSGSGRTYVGSNGRRQRAETPEGVFRFERRILGVRKAPLGKLYNPYYFRGGIAVHGSPSVPNYPASHGCIRVTLWDMDVLIEHLHVGEAIYVYGDRLPAPGGGIPVRSGMV